MNFINNMQNVWDFVDSLPEIGWMTPQVYLILSGVAIVVGITALRGNPTQGA